ncbi:MAG: Phosphoesterase PA-phosphatase related protein [Pedosphaera sp.]|nr:Phosphoesterase PA-phosphatase related protein [Pedosphaera sp.]
MHWLQALDIRLFHWVNPAMNNRVLDVFMPFCSGNAYFVPALILICLGLILRGGVRGRICVLMLIFVVGLGDGMICNTLKHLISRPRPFWDIADVHMPPGIGRTGSGSMPSSHAANWFAGTMVVFIYYRKSLRLMLPAAVLVSFSRIYNGVHYPSDVVAGAILGAGYAAGGVWTLDALWKWAGQRWFPIWWQRLPSLMDPVAVPAAKISQPVVDSPEAARRGDQQWIYLAYGLIFLQLLVKLAYINNGKLDLAESEAFQWIWSKHLAWLHFGGAHLSAGAQFLGTLLWGDTVFGVRFFAPIIATTISILLLHFLARTVNGRAAFWISLLPITVPLLAVGSTLMTENILSVLFWTAAMIAGWRAVQDNSRTREWFWVGLWMGLGGLSTHAVWLQIVCWVVFFAIWTPARQQLRRLGPYLALLISGICTMAFVAGDDLTDGPANVFTFPVTVVLLLNPFFFLIAVWAAFNFWRRRRENPLLAYLFSMGVPLFLIGFLFTFRSQVPEHWIAPAILPLFCFAIVYWDQQWRAGIRRIRFWLIPGLVAGGVAVVFMHDTNLIAKITGRQLPAKIDPMRPVKGWREMAVMVESARQKLLAEGKPVFIIGGHYGMASELTFNLPEAKAGVTGQPLVFCQVAKASANPFPFYPGYQDDKGQNAIFVQELKLEDVGTTLPPEELKQEFESVTDLGAMMVMSGGRAMHRIQICECRGLR